MAGSSVAITVDDREVHAAFNRLLEKSDDLEPFFRDLAERLIQNTEERFAQQVSPDGEYWEPLRPATKRRKKKNKNKILIASGDLMENLRYHASADELLFGTNEIYGAAQQFGREDANIPARLWLGINDDDQDVIIELALKHLTE